MQINIAFWGIYFKQPKLKLFSLSVNNRAKLWKKVLVFKISDFFLARFWAVFVREIDVMDCAQFKNHNPE